jgi:hypothetical protein
MTSHVVVVGADKGGVGKTTVSRTLLSYFKSKGIEFRAFDTESPKGVLQRFHPSETEIVDMRKTSGMMAAFDKIGTSPVTLIDVRAGLLSDLLSKLTTIGLLEAVKAGAMKLTLMHILGASLASFREIHDTQAVVGAQGSKHILVMNHINDSAFFGWNADAQEALKVGDGRIDIPQLDTEVAEHIEVASTPFQDFIEKTDESFVLRGLARGWLKEVYDQYDKLLTF